MFNRFTVNSSALALLGTLAGLALCSSVAQAGTTSTRYGTCLHRYADGYNQCWNHDYGPGTATRFATLGCSTYFVRFDGATPASGHGVPRTNGIAIQSFNSHWLEYATSWSGLSSWTGLGGLTSINAVNGPGGISSLSIYLGMPNSFARVRVQASGGPGCVWTPTA